MSAPRYTVALCTHNHADRLERTLADLTALRLPRAPIEFLVIDNGSRDATPDLLQGHRWPEGFNARVVREEKLGLSNARNRAVREARGEYIIFMDDDETADPEWLCAFERLIDDHSPDAFGGRIEVLFEDERPRWLTDDLLGFLGQLNRSDSVTPLIDADSYFHGGNFGFRKRAGEAVGDFDSMLGRRGTDNTGGEEVEFYRRLLSAGCKVWWTPHAVIHHRIQACKLARGYFIDLHYKAGRIAGSREHRSGSRWPPLYVYGQLWRAFRAALSHAARHGRDESLRKEMNFAYFLGKISGWIRPRDARA